MSCCLLHAFSPGRRDSSGIRLYYTATLRQFNAGIMELGLVYTPVMAIPPQETAFVLTGYCTDKCTMLVSRPVLTHALLFSLTRGGQHEGFEPLTWDQGCLSLYTPLTKQELGYAHAPTPPCTTFKF